MLKIVFTDDGLTVNDFGIYPVVTETVSNINLYNKDELKLGSFATTVEGKSDAYMLTGYIPVEPGDKIYWTAYLPEYGAFDYELVTKNYFMQYVSYLSTYDSEKTYIGHYEPVGASIDTSNNNAPVAWTVPEGVSYIRLSLAVANNRSELKDTLYICKNALPTIYAGSNQGSVDISCEAYLPEQIYVAYGTEFNIYNKNICPTSYDYDLTFQWESDIGTSNNDGIKFEPTIQDVGRHKASVMIYNSESKVVASLKTTINVITNEISNNQNILVIGDSLSNGKSWTNTIEELSQNKISITANGISGASSSAYYKNETVSNVTNPFYNSEVGHFDFSYYMNNTGTGITYDSVILFLGTNDISLNVNTYPRITPDNIYLTNIVDSIKKYDSNLNIYVITPLNSTESVLRRMAAYDIMKSLIKTFKSSSNVIVIPLEIAIDSINDFGESDKIHPLESGYNKFAHMIYSYICQNQ